MAWTSERAGALYHQPFMDLLYQAQSEHRRHFPANTIQVSELLSIKTGGCPEDCAYCSQSAHHGPRQVLAPLMSVEAVREAATRAKAHGSSRFCMGAAWRSLADRDLPAVCAMVREVKNLGLETCLTLGMLQSHQAQALKDAGLDYYNHNLDTAPDFYDQVITTRTYADRLNTLSHVREAGLKVCCGGILGMGETVEDRLALLVVLANLPEPPQSVPINHLVQGPDTPLGQSNPPPVDILDFVRTIATARLMMPRSWIRLSAGRDALSEEGQALCFLAGANSIFYGDKLLTAANQAPQRDDALLQKLGLKKSAPKTESLAGN